MEYDNSTRIKNPCNKCRYRCIGCHATCFMYKEWKNQLEIINKMKVEGRKFESARIERIIKTKKRYGHKR